MPNVRGGLVFYSRTRGLATLVSLAISSSLVTGCVASTIPPPLSPDELEWAEKSAPLPISLGVDTPKIDTGTEKFFLLRESDRVIRALRKTRLFRTVDYTHRFASPPDLRVTVSPVERLTVYRPYFTVFTLGLFPACISEIRGYSFSLKSPSTKRTLDIEDTFKGYRCGGWLPFLFNLGPGWSFLFPEERLDQRLKPKLISNIEQIRELAFPDPQ
jgi:hypothetical protein